MLLANPLDSSSWTPSMLGETASALYPPPPKEGGELPRWSKVLAGPTPEEPGTRIGPYKLLQPIGEGGMGTVWMAEQMEPIKRIVALKLIKPGMDSAQVLARF